MWEVMLYENGETYEFYIEGTHNAIFLIVASKEELETIINIATRSGHSIEIKKIKDED